MKHPILTIKRIVRMSLQNIKRNPWFAIASTTVMTLTLFTVAAFFMLTILVNKAADTAKEKVGLASINMKEWVSEAEVFSVREKVKRLGGVVQVNFVSKEEALDRFKAIHRDDPLLLEAVAEENPLFNSLEVRVDDPESFGGVKDLLASREVAKYVEDFSFDGDREATISRIGSVSNFIKRLGIALSAVFVLVALVIIFNTIRLGIFSRRTEIEIMYLNGATRSFIRLPFLIEGMLYGTLGIVFTVAVISLGVNSVDTTFTRYFGEIGEVKSFILENFTVFAAAFLAVGMGGGLLASWLAVSKHLKVS